jgi:hypothetical protein
MKSRVMGWAGNVVRVEARGGACRVLVGNLWEGDHLKDPDVDGSIILKLIFEEWVGRDWTGSMWLRIDTGGELF